MTATCSCGGEPSVASILLWCVPLCCVSMAYVHLGETVFMLDYNGSAVPSFSQPVDIRVPDDMVVTIDVR